MTHFIREIASVSSIPLPDHLLMMYFADHDVTHPLLKSDEPVFRVHLAFLDVSSKILVRFLVTVQVWCHHTNKRRLIF